MLRLLYAFLWDPTFAVGVVRGLALGAGAAASTGQLDPWLPGLPPWVGILLMAFGGFIRSSSHRRIPKTPDEPQ